MILGNMRRIRDFSEVGIVLAIKTERLEFVEGMQKQTDGVPLSLKSMQRRRQFWVQ